MITLTERRRIVEMLARAAERGLDDPEVAAYRESHERRIRELEKVKR